jgi:hypothetical protein
MTEPYASHDASEIELGFTYTANSFTLATHAFFELRNPHGDVSLV